MSEPTAVSTRDDRVLGLLLGTAAGDALGAAFEGKLLVTESALRAVEHASGPLTHTDDTVLSVVLAEHVADRPKSDPVDEIALANEFADAWRAEPWRGYGQGAAEVFRLISTGVSWQTASRAAFGGQGSFGNDVTALGSVPTALLAFLVNRDDPAATIRYAIRAGGDTDTIAAMAGALAGARHGASALPHAWIQRLEIAERIRAVALRLS